MFIKQIGNVTYAACQLVIMKRKYKMCVYNNVYPDKSCKFVSYYIKGK